MVEVPRINDELWLHEVLDTQTRFKGLQYLNEELHFDMKDIHTIEYALYRNTLHYFCLHTLSSMMHYQVFNKVHANILKQNYVGHLTNFIHNVQNSDETFIDNVTVHNLIEMSNEEFRAYLPIQKWYQEMNDIHDKQGKMLEPTDLEQVLGIDKKKIKYKCSACGSTNVEVKLRQTRGADEGATAFYKCKNCNKQWHI